MFCRNCGNQMDKGVKICPECGVTLNNNSVNKQKPILKNSENILIIVMGILTILSGIASLIQTFVLLPLGQGALSLFSRLGLVIPAITACLVIVWLAVIFVGIMVILKKRWAVISMRISYLLGIILFGLGFLIAFNYYVLFSLIISIVGYAILNVCDKALSKEEQSERYTFSLTGKQGNWICARCDTVNGAYDLFCRECGKQK